MSVRTDFSIDYNNKIISHTFGTDVYLVNDLYSYLQDVFDDVSFMAYDEPMTAQTPTEYTLIKGWFIPDESFKYLNGGAIRSIGWDASQYNYGIYIIKLSASGYTNFVLGDIGKEIICGSTTGTLLDYNNTLRKIYVRKVNGSVWSGSLTVSSGTGSGTVTTANTGESLYANVYSLGLLEPGTTNTLFVEQVNAELTNNEIINYWGTGHIDLVIKVKEAGTLIDSGILKVYCREYTDLYSHFIVNVSAGGRNPVPLATSNDSNNQTSSATVAGWNDVTITFGAITRDLADGSGLKPYDVEIDCGSRTSLLQVYERLKLVTSRNSGITLNGKPGQFYRGANSLYVENTQSPFGAFAGGQLFGAAGIWFKNVPVNDLNNYQVIDSNGDAHNSPYTAAGTFIIGDNLKNDPDAKITMFFNTTPAGNYGTINAIIVNDANDIPIKYDVNGNSIISWTFDYDANTQGGRTAGTNAVVTIVATGLSTGKLITVEHTITRSVGQNITLLADLERNYQA